MIYVCKFSNSVSLFCFSISTVYPPNTTLGVVIQYGKWSALQGASSEMVSSHSLKIHDFRSRFLRFSISIVLPIEQDTWCRHSIWKMISASRRVFWDGFQPFLKNTWCSVSFFLLHTQQTTKLDTWCRHSIWKMISASRRVFWDGFQQFFKNTWFSVSFSSLQYFDCLPIEQDT